MLWHPYVYDSCSHGVGDRSTGPGSLLVGRRRTRSSGVNRCHGNRRLRDVTGDAGFLVFALDSGTGSEWTLVLRVYQLLGSSDPGDDL